MEADVTAELLEMDTNNTAWPPNTFTVKRVVGPRRRLVDMTDENMTEPLTVYVFTRKRESDPFKFDRIEK